MRWAELFIIYIVGAVVRRLDFYKAPAVVTWAELFIIYIASAVARRWRSIWLLLL